MVYVDVDAFSNFQNPPICLQVENFDVHDVTNVFKDLCPNVVLLQLIILLHSLLPMINMFFLMK
jgi:hypothetical protein